MELVVAMLVVLVLFLVSESLDQRSKVKEKNDTLICFHNLKSTFLDQKGIDKVLIQLAVELNNVCTQEVNLQKFNLQKNTEGSPLLTLTDIVHNSECVLVNLHDQIKSAKKSFWDAHRLAKEFGFEVRLSFRNYLPEPVPPLVDVYSEYRKAKSVASDRDSNTQ